MSVEGPPPAEGIWAQRWSGKAGESAHWEDIGPLLDQVKDLVENPPTGGGEEAIEVPAEAFHDGWSAQNFGCWAEIGEVKAGDVVLAAYTTGKFVDPNRDEQNQPYIQTLGIDAPGKADQMQGYQAYLRNVDSESDYAGEPYGGFQVFKDGTLYGYVSGGQTPPESGTCTVHLVK